MRPRRPMADRGANPEGRRRAETARGAPSIRCAAAVAVLALIAAGAAGLGPRGGPAAFGLVSAALSIGLVAVFVGLLLAQENARRRADRRPACGSRGEDPPWRAILDALDSAVVALDSQHRVTYLNAAAARTVGPAGRDARTIDGPGSGAAHRAPAGVTAGLAKLLEGGADPACEQVHELAGGERRVLRWRLAPLPDTGVLAVGEDVTERKLAEDKFRVLFEHACDPHLLIDAGRVVECNAAAMRLLRLPDREAVLGASIAELAPNSQPDGVGSAERAAEVERIARERGSLRFAWVARRGDGEEAPLEASLTRVSWAGRAALLMTWIDVAERRRAEYALCASEERFRLAVAGSAVGIWDWDLATDVVYYSPRLTAMIGFDHGEFPSTVAAFLSRIHPDDRERIRAALMAHLYERAPYGLEFRVRTRSGRYLWVEARGQAVWDADGRPLRMAGSLSDVSERLRKDQALRDHVAELAAAKADLEAQALKLQAYSAQLEVAREQAEVANQAKSAFLANMSHEIRTPMTAILGFAETLQDEACPADERADAVRTILRNGQYLLSILNDILDLSKIEAGRMTVERVRCSLRSILTDVAALVRVPADAKGLTLTIDEDGPLPETIATDPVRLRQILLNLLSNAVKFTEIGGVRVVVGVERRAGAALLRFDVIDSGVGIASEQQARIFEPFTQADSSTTRRFGGTGLGLMISKRLAQILGGDVTLAESRVGVGTTFRATIAADPVATTGARVELTPPTAWTRDLADAEPPSGPSTLRGCRILLAEDGPDNRRLVAHVLRRAGAEVAVVENGRAAVDETLAAARAGRSFDALVTDMQMPIMDGYQAARLLRAAGYAGPIIALTAHAMASDRETCIECGCTDYVSKPIDRGRLLSQIAAAIATRRAAVVAGV
ncbi:MAG: PAS domain S-box protein [Phycisphaerae bacterium]